MATATSRSISSFDDVDNVSNEEKTIFAMIDSGANRDVISTDVINDLLIPSNTV